MAFFTTYTFLTFGSAPYKAAQKVGETYDKVVGKVGVASTSINRSVTAAGTGPKKLQYSIQELREKLDALNNVKFSTHLKSEFDKVSAEAEKVERQLKRMESGISGTGLGSKMKEWRQDFMQSLPGAELIKNPLTLAAGAVSGFWAATQKAMDAGKEKIKLQTLTGSQEIGGALYDGLTKFATDTVFGTEVYDMGAQMLANGIADADVLPIMKQLGDISMGDANKLGSLSLAFAQINGKGKLAGQELLQLINAGFNPLQVISEKTGESMGSLMKKMEDGKISVADVRAAFDAATGPGGKFQDMLSKVADTPYGKLEGFKGQLEQIVVKIGEVFLPMASKIVDGLSWAFDALGPVLEPLVAIIAAISAAVLIWAGAQWVLNAAIWANPVTWIIVGVVALIALIAYLISRIQGWGAAWSAVVNNAKLSWDYFTSAARLAWVFTVNSFMAGLNKIKSAWYSFKNAAGIGDEGENNAALAVIAADTEKRADEVLKAQKDFNKSQDNLKKTKNAFNEFSWGKGSKAVPGADIFTGKGIKPAGMPGMDNTQTGKTKAVKGSGLGKALAKTNEATATGGTKHNYITINLKDLVGVLNITGSDFKETTAQLQQQVEDALMRTLASAETAGI